MVEIKERGGEIIHVKNFLASKQKKNVLQIFVAFEFKNRAEKDTSEAHRQSSKAEMLENSN